VTDSVLVIGYGNELRRDDGVGPSIARAVAASEWPGVRALAVHQLTPELAEPLASARLAVFVDAAFDGGELSVRPVTPKPGSAALKHASDPAWLLGLARAIYGRQPPAWMVTVPVADVGFGMEMSREVRGEIRNAKSIVARLIEDFRHDRESSLSRPID
jgi:hydrogenase maturation protease